MKLNCLVCGEGFERPQLVLTCSKECSSEYALIKVIKRVEEQIKESLQDYLKREYEVNKRSFRWIVKELKINGRTVPKLLKRYNIEIRKGSEAVAAQWVGNETRRKEIGETFKNHHLGKPSVKRLDVKLITERLKEKGLKLKERVFVDGYAHFLVQCEICGYEFVKSSRCGKHGCVKCAIARRTFADQKTVVEERRKTGPWKKAVLKRDNYTCQCCGSKDELRTHHLYNFAQYPELRTELSNGMTLCANCHDSGRKGSFHNIYGCYYNTKEQMDEYLINREKIRQSDKSCNERNTTTKLKYTLHYLQ